MLLQPSNAMGESIKIFEMIDEDLASDNFDNLGETEEGDDLVKRQHYNTISWSQ